MKIIRDTYNDANMEHIYMVTFVETKDQQGTTFLLTGKHCSLIFSNRRYQRIQNGVGQCDRVQLR